MLQQRTNFYFLATNESFLWLAAARKNGTMEKLKKYFHEFRELFLVGQILWWAHHIVRMMIWVSDSDVLRGLKPKSKSGLNWSYRMLFTQTMTHSYYRVLKLKRTERSCLRSIEFAYHTQNIDAIHLFCGF